MNKNPYVMLDDLIPILNFVTSFQINADLQKTCKRHQVTARELQQSLDDSDRVTIFTNNLF